MTYNIKIENYRLAINRLNIYDFIYEYEFYYTIKKYTE